MVYGFCGTSGCSSETDNLLSELIYGSDGQFDYYSWAFIYACAGSFKIREDLSVVLPCTTTSGLNLLQDNAILFHSVPFPIHRSVGRFLAVLSFTTT